jgi:hypothetical protein
MMLTALSEQLGHGLIMRRRAAPSRRHPFVVRAERGLDLGGFDDLGWGQPLDRLQPTQISQRNDGRLDQICLAAPT